MIKRFSLIAFCIILTIASCKKKDSRIKPEDLPTALKSINVNDKAYQSVEYDEHGRIAQLSSGTFVDSFKYNEQNQVIEIIDENYAFTTSASTFVTKVFYKDGIPFSGSRKDASSHIKSPNAQYYVDSVSYKVINNEVTEIRYFDKKFYDYFTNELKYTNTKDTLVYYFSYLNNNLASETLHKYAVGKYTYGAKKGILSAKKLPFVLYQGAPPVLYGENELLTSDDTVEIHTYNYTYNQADFPVSAKVGVTYKADYAPTSYNQSFVYK
ncbi:hypothetical protein [Pedobacter foliorum]|uniref:hypothetical protein n=1 Tax=Pedobacter foliorum TaxID=2739058 RepID=UPI001564573B|nr:hypothetical protein [Pedobacter foliorum]NRF39210.1 hypothetical protein [Pedobacter foliorum]